MALLYKDGRTTTLPTSNFYLLRGSNQPKWQYALQWLSNYTKNFFRHANYNCQAYMYMFINWLRLLLVQFWLIFQIHQTFEGLLKIYQKIYSSLLDRQLCQQELYLETNSYTLSTIFFQFQKLLFIIIRLTQLLWAIFFQLWKLFPVLIRFI